MGAPQARKVVFIDADTEEVVELVMTLGDSLRGHDWAKKAYPNDPEEQDARSGVYAAYLAAKRLGAPHTDGDWLEWCDHMVPPAADDDGPEPAEGESVRPSSGI